MSDEIILLEHDKGDSEIKPYDNKRLNLVSGDCYYIFWRDIAIELSYQTNDDKTETPMICIFSKTQPTLRMDSIFDWEKEQIDTWEKERFPKSEAGE